MKTKNIIQIVETPIIDGYDFDEKSGGVINPAFLEPLNTLHFETTYVTPEPNHETDYDSRRAEDDYRNNYFNPADYRQRNGGQGSIASSWVYEFNSGVGSAAQPLTMATTTGTLPRSYGNYNDQHLSYNMDLNAEHKNRKGYNCWCCGKLFIWALIIISLLGIAISVAFIIYIEKFAVDRTNSTGSFNSSQVLITNKISDLMTSKGTTSKADIDFNITNIPSIVALNATTDESLSQTNSTQSIDLDVTEAPVVMNRTQEDNSTQQTTHSTDIMTDNSTVTAFESRSSTANDSKDGHHMPFANISSTSTAPTVNNMSLDHTLKPITNTLQYLTNTSTAPIVNNRPSDNTSQSMTNNSVPILRASTALPKTTITVYNDSAAKTESVLTTGSSGAVDYKNVTESKPTSAQTTETTVTHSYLMDANTEAKEVGDDGTTSTTGVPYWDGNGWANSWETSSTVISSPLEEKDIRESSLSELFSTLG